MKNDRRRPIKFRGFDWTELLLLQRIATNWPELPKDFKPEKLQSPEDAKAAYLIKEYLGTLTFCEGKAMEAERTKVCGYVRKWLAALAACGGYDTPVFKGIAACKSDDQMLRWVSWNLECMWT